MFRNTYTDTCPGLTGIAICIVGVRWIVWRSRGEVNTIIEQTQQVLMNCIVVEGSVCGVGGVACINGTCMCADKWQNSLEMDLLRGNQERAAKYAPCDEYGTVIPALYWVVFIVYFGGFVLQTCILRTVTHFKRTLPILLGFISAMVALLFRLSKGDARFGESLEFTFFIMNAFAFFYLGCAVFLSKYFNYLKKSAATSSSPQRAVTVFVNLLQPWRVAVVVFSGFNLFSVACFYEDLETKLILLRISFFLAGLFPFMWMVITNIAMINARESFASFLAQNSNVSGGNKSKLEIKVKRQLKTTKKVQNFTNIITAANIFVGWSAFFSDTFFYLWKYSLPVFICCWGLFIVTTTLIAWKSRATRSEKSAAERILSMRRRSSNQRPSYSSNSVIPSILLDRIRSRSIDYFTPTSKYSYPGDPMDHFNNYGSSRSMADNVHSTHKPAPSFTSQLEQHLEEVPVAATAETKNSQQLFVSKMH